MIGCYDFCGHYEWTFAWLEREGGRELLTAYWAEAIGRDSQRHARELIAAKGFAGMSEYWGHTLLEESPERGFSITSGPGIFRIDMHDCPSKGFLLRNDLRQHADYCDHCIGWIGPMMRDAGFVIDHEHNHRGQCWWEIHPAASSAVFSAPGTTAGDKDVRMRAGWTSTETVIDRYVRANSVEAKTSAAAPSEPITPAQ
jgi:hypothetical protein